MGYFNAVGILDGSNQTIFTATTNMLVTGATATKRGSGTVTMSAWLQEVTNSTLRPIVLGAFLDDDYPLLALKGQALLAGDTIIAQASGSDDLLGDIYISVYGEGTGTRTIIPHLQMEVTHGDSGACGTCAIGGKVIEAAEFIEGQSYTFNVDVSLATITAGKAIQIYKWTQAPNWVAGNPPTASGLVWVANLPSTGGSFNFTLPASGFYGFTIKAGNPSKSNQWDALCCTWNRTTRTIIAQGFA